MGQNIPNPFNEHTQIPFYLPSTVKAASIQFTDSRGSIIKSIEINDRGKGVIHIAAVELNSAVYNYTLIADGKVIDTKRMVKNKVDV